MSVDLVTGRARCWRASCDWRGTMRDGLVRDAEAVRALDRQDAQARATQVQRVVAACRPIAPQGPVAAYLRSRHLLPPWPDDLREAELWHGPSRFALPCLVALVRGERGAITGVHRTFVPRGRQVTRQPKMMLGRVRGGAVRLAPIGEDGRLVLTEGIEDALAAMQLWPMDGPAWACLSASGIRSVQLPYAAREILIVADDDPSGVGQRFAVAAARRLADEGRLVSVYLPAGAKDAAELLARREAG